MSTAFKDFLRAQAAKEHAEIMQGKAIVDDWRAAIERLFAQIRAWLKESDPDGLIEIKENKQEIREKGLGYYVVPRLDLSAFGKWIGIVPKVRGMAVAGEPTQSTAPGRAFGRVDVTDELQRYVLHRVHENGQEVWLIEGLDIGGRDAAERRPGEVRYFPRSELMRLDQATFEKALMSYLQ
jgi:hypothetical protein